MEKHYPKIIYASFTIIIGLIVYIYTGGFSHQENAIAEAKSIAQSAVEIGQANSKTIDIILQQNEQTNSFLNYIAQTLDENGINGRMPRPTYKNLITTK